MKSLKEERLWLTKPNKDGDLMKIIEYNNNNNIVIEFQDEWKETIKTKWTHFNNGNLVNPHKIKTRLGAIKTNAQNCLMKCVEYTNSHNIIIEFQDEYKYKVKTTWDNFEKEKIKNLYHPNVCGVGIIGSKYPRSIDGKTTKEYQTWSNMIHRCFNKKGKRNYPTYAGVTCCEEWLLYENFYEWLHNQENFDKWSQQERSALDKDILIKGNKIYAPNTCCLVSDNINGLFEKADKSRGNLPIGVKYEKRNNSYYACCRNGDAKTNPHATFLGYASNEIESFNMYKQYKENVIKSIAQEEYNKGNITKKCYDAMMKYEVEITD